MSDLGKNGLDDPIRDDGFLCCRNAGGSGRVGQQDDQSHDPRLCRIVAKLRNPRLAWVWFCLASLARIVPSFILSRAKYRLDDGSIWDEEVARNGGPSDTGVIRYSRRVDEEEGYRVMAMLLPIWVLVLILITLFCLLPAEPIPATSVHKHEKVHATVKVTHFFVGRP